MKRHAGKTKIGILLLALIVALGGMGVAFAAWTDIITIQGTITTATIDWELGNDTFTWECEPSEETAWAIGPDSIEYEGPGGGWASYFAYTIGDPTLTVPLLAGQTELVGEVRVSTEGDSLIIDYTTFYGWEMTETHVYVSTDAPPKMAPGPFDYGHDTIDPSVTDIFYTIPLAALGVGEDDEVYIAAQAVVTDWSGDCDVQPPTIVDHSVVVTLIDVSQGSWGDLCFKIHNSGTIPIRISDIGSSVVPDDPVGVTVELTTDPTDTQLHPGDDPVPVCVRIDVTASGTYTVTITVNAVQWNLYP